MKKPDTADHRKISAQRRGQYCSPAGRRRQDSCCCSAEFPCTAGCRPDYQRTGAPSATGRGRWRRREDQQLHRQVIGNRVFGVRRHDVQRHQQRQRRFAQQRVHPIWRTSVCSLPLVRKLSVSAPGCFAAPRAKGVDTPVPRPHSQPRQIIPGKPQRRAAKCESE